MKNKDEPFVLFPLLNLFFCQWPHDFYKKNMKGNKTDREAMLQDKKGKVFRNLGYRKVRVI